MTLPRMVWRNGIVLTLDPQLGNFPQADVLIEGTRIAAIGPQPAVQPGSQQQRWICELLLICRQLLKDLQDMFDEQWLSRRAVACPARRVVPGGVEDRQVVRLLTGPERTTQQFRRAAAAGVAGAAL